MKEYFTYILHRGKNKKENHGRESVQLSRDWYLWELVFSNVQRHKKNSFVFPFQVLIHSLTTRFISLQLPPSYEATLRTKDYELQKFEGKALWVFFFCCACSTILIPEPSVHLMNYCYDNLGFSEHLLMCIKIHHQGGRCSFIHIVFDL